MERPMGRTINAPWDEPYMYLSVGYTMECTVENIMECFTPEATPRCTPWNIMVKAMIVTAFLMRDVPKGQGLSHGLSLEHPTPSKVQDTCDRATIDTRPGVSMENPWDRA